MSLGIKPFIIFALIMISPLGPTHSHADVYTWTDENGTRHFSNITPPQRGESSLMKERLTALFQGEKFKVIKIYDGDTFKARGAGLEFKIRLAGIDTPETGGRNKKGQPFGREATQMLSRLILNKKVRLSQYGTGG
ncbi:MAG: thermonuclease family protein [Desulfobacter sp.]|nr:thermonuclease family protein [Desulfobacter sp.]WDP84691.1 MAG: thermonuclease family protein [Desulfobacter sp.]